ncbi:MAG TPA: cellulase family glycosylhydrolase, partial [Chloroflexota bacterium]
GAQWVREEFTASDLHSTPAGKYSWEPYDRIVNEERRAGLHILGLLDYSNTWSFQDHASVPHSAISRVSADFARYAFAMARHFRGRITYWQIWNEPNTEQFWQPFPVAGDYATLVTAASRAIRRADPNAHVVLAGVSGMDLSFVRDVAARTHAFDVVAVHPYRSLPEPSFAGQVSSLRTLRHPVWFSEIGWAAGDGCDGCYDETEQARYLVRFYTLAAAAGIQRVFWYDLRDDVQSTTNPEAHFGLVRRDLSAKPAFTAYALLSRLLTGSTFVRADLHGGHGLYAFRFAGRKTDVTVVWNASDTTRQVSIPWAHPYAQLLNANGDVLAELSTAAGHITITAPQGGEPFYLVDRVPTYYLAPLGPLLRTAPRPPARPPSPHRPQSGKRTTTKAQTGAWAAPVLVEKPKTRSTPSPSEHAVSAPVHRVATSRAAPKPTSTPAH